MALNENLRLSDLLAPIPGDSPVGPDLKYSNEFSEIEWAHSQGQDALPPTTPPGFPGAEAEEHFNRVVELGSDFLLNQSKDLRVASFLTSALLRVGMGEEEDPIGAQCFLGLSFGMDLLRGLIEGFWDHLHSSIPSRSAVLGVLGSDAMTLPVRLVPLTHWGHCHFHYRDWAREAIPAMAPAEENALWAGNFNEGFADTDRESYERLAKALEQCSSSLDGLDTVCKEKFGEAQETPPRFSDLKEALKDLSKAATQLLEKKAPPPPPEPDSPPAPSGETAGDPAAPAATSPQPEAVQGEGEKVVGDHMAPPPQPDAAPQPPPPPAAPAPPTSPEPKGPEQAVGAIISAARVLRNEDPTNPVPYLLVRGLRWGEVRQKGDSIDPQLLEAPASEDRKRLRGLFLQESWEQLLEASEEVMASEAGRGWLDLQRYSILSVDKLGADFQPVAAALRGALVTVLKDLPALATSTLMDDSAAASPDTITWLEAAGFIRGDDGGEEGLDPSEDVDPDLVRREASFGRASKMVQGGDPDGAIRLLMRRADSEKSERARFITRVEAAAIMVARGETAVARPILDDLLKEVDEHKLEDWEAGEAVARPLGLLYQCLDASDGQLRQQIYQRICRMDPLLARSIGEPGNG